MDAEAQNKIETAYNQGLALEKAGKFEEAAHFYHQVLELDKNDCAGVSVRLASMGQGERPDTAPPAYVATLFDQCADVFDMILVDSLGYGVPNLLRAQFDRLYPNRIFRNMLDLGCGTGLVGEAFEDICENRTGIDLSQNMVEIAGESDIYQHLFVGDILRFLEEKSSGGNTENWDLIIAADVLPYMGDLEVFFRLVSKMLNEGGVFAFSSENLAKAELSDKMREEAGQGFAVGKYQRFAHSSAYIEKCLTEAGLKIAFTEDIIVRQEQNKPVAGQNIIAGKY